MLICIECGRSYAAAQVRCDECGVALLPADSPSVAERVRALASQGARRRLRRVETTALVGGMAVPAVLGVVGGLVLGQSWPGMLIVAAPFIGLWLWAAAPLAWVWRRRRDAGPPLLTRAGIVVRLSALAVGVPFIVALVLLVARPGEAQKRRLVLEAASDASPQPYLQAVAAQARSLAVCHELFPAGRTHARVLDLRLRLDAAGRVVEVDSNGAPAFVRCVREVVSAWAFAEGAATLRMSFLSVAGEVFSPDEAVRR